MSEDYEDVQVRSRAEWRTWLAEHHDASPGVWLVLFKKAAGESHVSYEQSVEEAICFGWVDSRPRRVDEHRWALLMTPRSPGSRWSRPNKERVARLEKAGLMDPAGTAVVAAARESGGWDALNDVEDLVEPEDLRDALDEQPAARAHWNDFPPSTRRGILEWILDAVREDTRRRRIEKTVSEAADGRRANQWRPPKG